MSILTLQITSGSNSISSFVSRDSDAKRLAGAKPLLGGVMHRASVRCAVEDIIVR